MAGEKNFGTCNGQKYRQRGGADYHSLTAEMEDGYETRNAERKSMFSGNFIDLISLVQQPDGRVRVFTDDGRFISQDCRHLTQVGAQYYARLIDWEQLRVSVDEFTQHYADIKTGAEDGRGGHGGCRSGRRTVNASLLLRVLQ